MKRIALSKEEKLVLRWIVLNRDGLPPGIDDDVFLDAVVSLTEKKLVKSKINYDDVLAAAIASIIVLFVSCKVLSYI